MKYERVSIPEPDFCAECRKPIGLESRIVHVGDLDEGLTWHHSCYKLRECTEPREMN